jgi:hypothetical protein
MTNGPRIEMQEVTLRVPAYHSASGLGRPWPDEYRLSVVVNGDQVLIKGDAAGLKGLAVQLLALARATVPVGYHSDLDAITGELDAGSASVTLLRDS